MFHKTILIYDWGWHLIHSLFFLFFFNVYLFLRQRETEHEQGRGRERGRHRMRNRLQAVSTEPDEGLELTNCEIMTWAEVGRLTDQATQAPHPFNFFNADCNSLNWFQNSIKVLFSLFEKHRFNHEGATEDFEKRRDANGLAFQEVPSGVKWKVGSRCETGAAGPGEGLLGLSMGTWKEHCWAGSFFQVVGFCLHSAQTSHPASPGPSVHRVDLLPTLSCRWHPPREWVAKRNRPSLPTITASIQGCGQNLPSLFPASNARLMCTISVVGFSCIVVTPRLFFPGSNFIPAGTTLLGLCQRTEPRMPRGAVFLYIFYFFVSHIW